TAQGIFIKEEGEESKNVATLLQAIILTHWRGNYILLRQLQRNISKGGADRMGEEWRFCDGLGLWSEESLDLAIWEECVEFFAGLHSFPIAKSPIIIISYLLIRILELT